MVFECLKILKLAAIVLKFLNSGILMGQI